MVFLLADLFSGPSCSGQRQDVLNFELTVNKWNDSLSIFPSYTADQDCLRLWSRSPFIQLRGFSGEETCPCHTCTLVQPVSDGHDVILWPGDNLKKPFLWISWSARYPLNSSSTYTGWDYLGGLNYTRHPHIYKPYYTVDWRGFLSIQNVTTSQNGTEFKAEVKEKNDIEPKRLYIKLFVIAEKGNWLIFYFLFFSNDQWFIHQWYLKICYPHSDRTLFFVFVFFLFRFVSFCFFNYYFCSFNYYLCFPFLSTAGERGFGKLFYWKKCKLRKAGLSKPRLNEGQLYWKLTLSYLILFCQNSIAMVTLMLTYAWRRFLSH